MLFPCHNLHLNIGWSYVIHTVHQLWLFVYYSAIHKSIKHIHCMQCLYLIRAIGWAFCMNECPSHQREIKIVCIRCNREIASCWLKKKTLLNVAPLVQYFSWWLIDTTQTQIWFEATTRLIFCWKDKHTHLLDDVIFHRGYFELHWQYHSILTDIGTSWL